MAAKTRRAVFFDSGDDTFSTSDNPDLDVGTGTDGVASFAKDGDTALTGDVTLSEGTGITLTQTGQQIEVAASGGTGNSFTTTGANFTQPSVSGTVTVTVGATAWMGIGQLVFVETGGYYSVDSITNSTHVVLLNLGYAGNAAPAATITSGAAVSPGGVQGATGSTGAAGSGAQLDYAQITSDVTVSGSSGTPTTVINGSSVSYSGSQRIKIEFFTALFLAGSAAMIAEVYRDSTLVGRVCQSSPNIGNGVTAAVFETPSNASHTYHIKAWKNGGTDGTIAAGTLFTPAYMRITAA